MALVTTVSGTTSNSYTTVAEIEAGLYGNALSTWKAIESNAEREAYAIRATTIIDLPSYRGDKYDEDQVLQFPRNYNYTTDADTDVDTAFIPPAVKKAQIAQVASMLNGFGDGFSDQILEYRAKGVKSMGMGAGVSASFDGKPAGPRDFLCAEARVLLAQFFSHPTIRLERG